MGTTGRDKRAAKQRRRDERRGRTPDAGPPAPDRGLPPETLHRVLLDTAADLAAGHDSALTELRHVLVEHLARRRPAILDACDTVLRGVPVGDLPTDPADLGTADPTRVAAESLLAELRARGAVEGVVPAWADRERFRAELVATATVTVLAGLTVAGLIDPSARA